MQSSNEDATGHARTGVWLEALARRLGIASDVIDRLQRENESFREISGDYEACCDKLQSLEQQGKAASAKHADYLEIRDQLEQELRSHLEGADSSRPNGRGAEPTKD